MNLNWHEKNIKRYSGLAKFTKIAKTNKVQKINKANYLKRGKIIKSYFQDSLSSDKKIKVAEEQKIDENYKMQAQSVHSGHSFQPIENLENDLEAHFDAHDAHDGEEGRSNEHIESFKLGKNDDAFGDECF